MYIEHTEDEKQLAIDMYLDDVFTVKEICKNFHLAHETFAAWLHEEGLMPMRRGRRKSVPVDRVKLRGLVLEGLSDGEIGEMLGVDRGVVRRRMREWMLARPSE